MHWQDYRAVSTVDEGVAALQAHPGRARYVAAGTDLMIQLEREAVRELVLLDVSGVPEMRRIAVEGSRLVIGAAVTMAELAGSALVREHARALAEGAVAMGSPQIRNVATVGGNLVNASPAADTVPPLAVAGAVAELVGPDGRREVPVAQLAVCPGRTCLLAAELVTRLFVPLANENEGQAFLKMGRRVALSISLVNVAARVVVEGPVVREVAVALGAVSPCCLVVDHAAQDLLGGRVPDEILLDRLRQAVEAEVDPISDIRAGADYRRKMAGVLARRAVEAAYKRALAPDPPVGGGS